RVVAGRRTVRHLHAQVIERRERSRLFGRRQRQIAWNVSGRRRAAILHADDDGVASAVLKEVADEMTEVAAIPQAAEAPFEVAEAGDRGGAVDRSAARAADERRHRRRHADDRAGAARKLLDVDAGG